MYTAGEITSINWELILDTIDSTVDQDYFDVIVRLPDGTSTYYTNPTTGWIQPVYTASSRVNGNVTYTITPDFKGLHTIQLVTGTNASYEVLSAVHMYVNCVSEEYVSATEVCGLNTYNELVKCPVDRLSNVVWGRSTTYFLRIEAMGRHADPGKIVIVGALVPTGGFNNYRDIGVMDTTTGVITNIIGALDSCGGSTNFRVLGIDCNRNTGVYCVTTTGFGSQNYPCYYSTDLTTWTTSTYPANNNTGQGPVYYDDLHQLWYWNLGDTRMNTSADDGLNWFTQTIYYEGFGNLNVGRARGYTDSRLDPFDSGSVFFGGSVGRVYRSKPVPGVAPIFTTTSSPPGGIQEVTHYNDPLISPRPNSLINPVYNYNNQSVHVMTSGAQILTSFDVDGYGDVWEVSSLTNDLRTHSAGFWGEWYYINGSYYAMQSNFDGHWKQTTDGAPTGPDWAIDVTGGIFSWDGTPFQDDILAKLNNQDEPFCLACWTTNINEQYVYFDIG